MTKKTRIGLLSAIWSLAFVFCGFSADWTPVADDSLPAGYYNYDTVTINSGITITCKGNTALNTGVVITCYNLIVNTGGKISADSQGYPANQGPGKPTGLYGGGSYGGYGGKWSGSDIGAVYGSIKNPIDLGSGGNLGKGGGYIILNVSNELKVNGIISADGQEGGGAGSGSGGSIKISTKILSGSGSITANGGTASNNDCDGGGGRIAIYYEQNSFTGIIRARRGTYSYGTNGGCGTIYLKSSSQQNGDLILDGGTYASGYYTPISGSLTFDTLIIKDLGHCEVPVGSTITIPGITSNNSSNILQILGTLNLPGSYNFNSIYIKSNGGLIIPDGNLTIGSNGTLEINSPVTFNNLTIQPNGRITHSSHASDTELVKRVYITVLNNMTVENGGAIDVAGKGYPAGKGPGKTKVGNAGASYGGTGALWGGAGTPGDTYGSDTLPVDLGSGGLNSSGGGAVYLTVWGTLQMDGSITATGIAFVNSVGSGGSVFIQTPNFKGNVAGTISVKGGVTSPNAGEGGGGRIAVWYHTYNYAGTYDTSGGNVGAQGGTRYLREMTFHLPPRATIIDNPAYSSPIPGKRPTFRWTATTDQENDTLQFEIQISQDSSFSSVVVSAASDNSTAGFQYSTNSGITWENFPSVGVKSDSIPPVKASYTVQQDLWVGNWYWRVRAKDLDGNGSWSDTGYLPSIIGDLLVKITSPADSIVVYEDRIKVEGTIEQSITQTISINGVSGDLTLADNKFSLDVNLEIGKNTVVVTGNGVLGNYISDTRVIYRLKLPVSVIEEKIGVNGGTVRLDDRDGDLENDSRIEIEQGTLEKEVGVKIKNLDGDTPIYGNIPSYEILVDGKEHYRFKKKIRMVLSYRNLNVKESDEDKLKIFYWDGVKWQLVGGEVNKSKKVVSTYTNHVSRYAVMVLPASKEIMINVSPSIFTPNGDGINDMVIFNCSSYSGGNIEIKIFTDEGKLVRQITETMTGSGISIAWDGLDANNNLAETGVYLYNVVVSGKAASSGSMIIAK